MEKCAFYKNILVFYKICIYYLILSLQYVSIFSRLDLIKLLFLIISLILNEIILLHFKKCRNNSLTIRVYLCTTIYLLIILNLLEYFWVASRVTSLSSDIELNPSPKSNALNHCFLTSLEFKQHINTYVYKSFPSISMHFCPQI